MEKLWRNLAGAQRVATPQRQNKVSSRNKPERRILGNSTQECEQSDRKQHKAFGNEQTTEASGLPVSKVNQPKVSAFISGIR